MSDGKVRLSDQQVGELKRRMDEVQHRLDHGVINFDEAMKMLQRIVEGEFIDPLAQNFDWQVSPTDQIRRAKQWNKEFGWGFPESVFTDLFREIPCHYGGYLTAIVLDIHLGDFEQTFAAAVDRIRTNFEVDGLFSWERNPQVRGCSGIHQPNQMKWKVVDLARVLPLHDVFKLNRSNEPTEENSVWSAVLWAAAYFPKWLEDMNGKNVPFVVLPGIDIALGNRSHVVMPMALRWQENGNKVVCETIYDHCIYQDIWPYRKHNWARPAIVQPMSKF